jgi:hypothetical protein
MIPAVNAGHGAGVAKDAFPKWDVDSTGSAGIDRCPKQFPKSNLMIVEKVHYLSMVGRDSSYVDRSEIDIVRGPPHSSCCRIHSSRAACLNTVEGQER